MHEILNHGQSETHCHRVCWGLKCSLAVLGLEKVSCRFQKLTLWVFCDFFHNDDLPRKVRHGFGQTSIYTKSIIPPNDIQPIITYPSWTLWHSNINSHIKFAKIKDRNNRTIRNGLLMHNVEFWRCVIDMALVKKHVVTLTFANLG